MELPEIEISATKVFEILHFPITNTFLISFFVGMFLFFLFYFSFKKKSFLPNFFQNFSEWILESILNYIEGIYGSREKALKIFPLAAFSFLFVFLSNLLEILPGVGVFHFLRSPSSDLSFTLGLAIFAMGLVQVLAIEELGFFHYLKKFLNFKNPIYFFVGILEALGEIIRTFSLALRLFGNLLAGEILLLVISHLFSFLLPIPFLILEIFVGFVQALIFSSLIVIFYGTATAHEKE